VRGTRAVIQVIIPLLALEAATMVLADIDSPARSAVSLLFLLFCPGFVVVQFLRLDDPLTEWTLTVALSIAIDTAVALVLLYAGGWSPRFAVVGIAACTVFLNGVAIWRRNAIKAGAG
jgi:uncharacterized membrane protein